MDEGPERSLGSPPPAGKGHPNPPEPWWKKVPWAPYSVACGAVLVLIALLVLTWNTRSNLTDKIHNESTEIRGLVNNNARKLDVLAERTNTIKADIEDLDRKLDRALDLPRKAQATDEW